MSRWPKIPFLPLIARTPREQFIFDLLGQEISIDATYARLMANRPTSEATIQANKLRESRK